MRLLLRQSVKGLNGLKRVKILDSKVIIFDDFHLNFFLCRGDLFFDVVVSCLNRDCLEKVGCMYNSECSVFNGCMLPGGGFFMVLDTFSDVKDARVLFDDVELLLNV